MQRLLWSLHIAERGAGYDNSPMAESTPLPGVTASTAKGDRGSDVLVTLSQGKNRIRRVVDAVGHGFRKVH